MKGKSPLFNNIGFKNRFSLNLQFFATKRVSSAGLELQERVSNGRLKNLIGELYREGAVVGDGSAMAAASHQVKTGELVGGRDHLIKINERITNAYNIIKREKLSASDKAYAEKLIIDMKKSLKGDY